MPDLRSHPANTSFKPGLCVVYNLSFMFPCVLDVPVALHLERLAACYMLAAAPGTDRDYSTARILAGGGAAVRHNFMRGLTARKIGMISQIISPAGSSGPPRSVSLNIESRYGNPEVEHMSLPYISQYLSASRQSKVCAK